MENVCRPPRPAIPGRRRRRWRAGPSAVVAVLLALLAAGCDPAARTGASGTSPGTTVRLYTSVTQQTVDAVVAGFTAAHPSARVEVFRATTGQLNARIAADRRSGGLRADVIWGTDPLSMQDYADQGLLAAWPVPGTDVPAAMRTDDFVATRVLFVVIVARRDLAHPPRTWQDLTRPELRGKVALPDPALAGSALAALGYFSQAPGYGTDFYRRLKANGAVQVGAVPQVVTDVAQGRYQAGITLDSEVRAAAAKGSPVTMVWPEPGAVAVYSPIAATTAARGSAPSDFLQYVLSGDGQRRIAATGWQPAVPGIPGPARPADAQEVSPDWTTLFGRQRQLLAEYRTIYPT